jgi:hypothetical protein
VPRLRKYATNAARQKAYRDRQRNRNGASGAEVGVTIPWRVDPDFVRELYGCGVSIGFIAKRLKVRHAVVRACIAIGKPTVRAPEQDAKIVELLKQLQALEDGA